ncbi:MAG: hypothetical protein M1542_08245 [Thermotogae bacterium]|jgi:hypothetical protein|nr:hypothetical protein [Thermotogota bacterium]MCL5033217.1 hypothetical protein [Thermotogota bacterium]
MEIFLWEKYEIYFYDEVVDFMEKLGESDPDKATEIFQDFFEKIKNGIGLPTEYAHGHRKLKNLHDDLWEYREKSQKIECLIRIYFGIDKENKIIILLGGQFKHDDKEQKSKLNTIRKRWDTYKGKRCKKL